MLHINTHTYQGLPLGAAPDFFIIHHSARFRVEFIMPSVTPCLPAYSIFLPPSKTHRLTPSRFLYLYMYCFKIKQSSERTYKWQKQQPSKTEADESNTWNVQIAPIVRNNGFDDQNFGCQNSANAMVITMDFHIPNHEYKHLISSSPVIKSILRACLLQEF